MIAGLEADIASSPARVAELMGRLPTAEETDEHRLRYLHSTFRRLVEVATVLDFVIDQLRTAGIAIELDLEELRMGSPRDSYGPDRGE